MKNFITLFPDYFRTISNFRFLRNCLTIYCWIPVSFITIVVFYIKNQIWRRLLLFVTFFVGYLMLVNISYPSILTPEFYIENLYIPLAFFLVLPLIFDLLPTLENKKLAPALLLLIIISWCIRIYSIHLIYTARLDYERKILNKYDQKKVLVQATKTDTAVLLMIWGTPYELLLLSESERNCSASVILDDHPDDRDWIRWMNKSLVVNWNLYKYSQVNNRYFNFTDTSSFYTIIK